MKKVFLKTSLLLLGSLVLPLATLGIIYCAIPNQYQKTYLGELPQYFKKLVTGNNKKIIVIGGSNVAFGLDVDQAEEATGYKVVPFGLYATLGTKLMLDLSKASLHSGDIVVITPEINQQSTSLYFNPLTTLQAVGGRPIITSCIASENKKEMLYKISDYVSGNFQMMISKEKKELTGVYQRSSFNENCNMIYDRPKNIMSLRYDPTLPVTYDANDLSSEFVDYLNDYAKKAKLKNVHVYYSFSPVNIDSIENGNSDSIQNYYDTLVEKLSFPVISSPYQYIYENSLFYDSNFHLNNRGSAIRTQSLIEDIYRYEDIDKKVSINVPEINENAGDDEGDDDYVLENIEDEACFTYESYGTGIAVNGVKSEYQDKEILKVPSSIDGKNVIAIKPNTLSSCSNLKEVHFYKPISAILSGAFNGCSKLEKIFVHTKAQSVTVSIDGTLLNGCNPNAKIYVPKKAYYDFATDYFWSNYATYIESFE